MRCPICSYVFTLGDFNEIEINQGGKNEKCPWCEWLLWVPTGSDPLPVPIPVILDPEIPDSDFEVFCRKAIDNPE